MCLTCVAEKRTEWVRVEALEVGDIIIRGHSANKEKPEWAGGGSWNHVKIIGKYGASTEPNSYTLEEIHRDRSPKFWVFVVREIKTNEWGIISP